MADLIWLDDWISIRKSANPNWKIPENTELFKEGILQDLEELSDQLGVDLALYVILPKS